jgi:hypothetical protein
MHIDQDEVNLQSWRADAAPLPSHRRIAPKPDTGAPPEADIAQQRPGGSFVQEHPRMLQKDPRVL